MNFLQLKVLKEDVTEIILNIKVLALKMTGEGPELFILMLKGPGEVNMQQT